MTNLEVRIRTCDDLVALPFAEIPFRMDLIQNVPQMVADIGGYIGDFDLAEATLSCQIAHDSERAYLEVVVGGDD